MLHHVSHYDYDRHIGLKAFCDGFAHDEEGGIYLLSIVGPDSQVKGIGSAVVSFKEIILRTGSHETEVRALRGQKYRIISARLEGNILHSIVLLEDLICRYREGMHLVLVKPDGDLPHAVFTLLNARMGTPLLESWQHPVITRMQHRNLIRILQGNVALAQVTATENQLDAIIQEGVRSRELRF